MAMPVAARKPPTRRLRPLKVTDAFRAFVVDQLKDLDDVVPRAMFGGVGLYCRGIFFGIIARDMLYLKVDASNLADYKRAGAKPFKPYADSVGHDEYPRCRSTCSRARAIWSSGRERPSTLRSGAKGGA